MNAVIVGVILGLGIGIGWLIRTIILSRRVHRHIDPALGQAHMDSLIYGNGFVHVVNRPGRYEYRRLDPRTVQIKPREAVVNKERFLAKQDSSSDDIVTAGLVGLAVAELAGGSAHAAEAERPSTIAEDMFEGGSSGGAGGGAEYEAPSVSVDSTPVFESAPDPGLGGGTLDMGGSFDMGGTVDPS